MKLTDFHTCKTIEIPADCLVVIEEGKEETPERNYLWSDVHYLDMKTKGIVVKRVVESQKYILGLRNKELEAMKE